MQDTPPFYTPPVYDRPKYTMRWLGTHIAYALVLALLAASVAAIIAGFAGSRNSNGMLSQGDYDLVSQSVLYCYGIVAISSVSLMLIELAFRKAVSYLQYALIAVALTIFYLLLLAMAEKMPFAAAYSIVSVMTISLISVFVNGLSHNIKAVRLTAIILVVEYALLYILINLGSMALLVGSLLLFILVALAMYFTLKLKVENEELFIK